MQKKSIKRNEDKLMSKEKVKAEIRENGITLIALIITIIVLLILAGITISAVIGNKGILNNVKNASTVYTNAEAKEKAALILQEYEMQKAATEAEGKTPESEEDFLKRKKDNGDIDGYKTNGDGTPSEITIGGKTVPIIDGKPSDPQGTNNGNNSGTTNGGSSDSGNNGTSGGASTPKVTTEMTPVKYDESTSKWVECSKTDSDWYNYENKNWANVKTADGSMWVWIPRYEYKIDTTNYKFDVKFVPVTQTTADSGYVLHPAFTDDSANSYTNGGWDSELTGFWVAKYEAGYQDKSGTVQKSNLTYTSSSGTYLSTSNAWTYSDSLTNYYGTITKGTTKLSYPVFKADVYSYDMISASDAYLLSKEISKASMYGLSGSVDSHMQKPSEWGAVAYLAQSQYGLNGTDIEINSYFAGDHTNQVFAKTSYGSNSTANDTGASTTGNMTGVFDMSGGLWETQAGGFAQNNTDHPEWHNKMITTGTTSSKYVTIYDRTIYQSSTISSGYKLGDAIGETKGWYSDYCDANNSSGGAPVWYQGGFLWDGDSAGLFGADDGDGSLDYRDGFRAVLVA